MADVVSIQSLVALVVNDCSRVSESAFSNVRQCATGLQAIAVGGTGIDFSMFAWLKNHLHRFGAPSNLQVTHSIVSSNFVESQCGDV